MTRALVLTATFVLLGFLVGQANHHLAPLQVYLFTGGLVVTYAGLWLRHRSGLAAMAAGGLLADAGTPVPSGTHLMLFVLAFLIIRQVRERIPREEPAAQVVVALFANLVLFLLLSFLRIGETPAPARVWTRLFVDLLASQVVVALIGPWFFALQARALQLARQQSPALR